MASKWVVDADHPEGHLVPMTAEEEAQLAADLAASAAADEEQAERDENADTIRAGIQSRMVQIRQARTAIGNGNLFAGLSANERAVIDGLLQNDLYMGRILLNQFEATT